MGMSHKKGPHLMLRFRPAKSPCEWSSLLRDPYPYRGGGRGGTKPSCRIPFFLLGNPGMVIQPLKWNCKVTFLNKPWALVRKYLRLAPEELSASMMTAAQFWRDAIPTYVLLQSDMCLAQVFNFHLLAKDMEWWGILIIEKAWLQTWNFKMKFQYDSPLKFHF